MTPEVAAVVVSSVKHAVTTKPHFLPDTLAAYGSILAALLSAAGGFYARKNGRKIDDVHVLVNGQLHAKLDTLNAKLTAAGQPTIEVPAEVPPSSANIAAEPPASKHTETGT